MAEDYVTKTLDRFEGVLATLEERSNKIVTEIAVMKVRVSMIAAGITIFISIIVNIIIYLLKVT